VPETSRTPAVALVLVAGLGSSPNNWLRLRDALPAGVEAVVATRADKPDDAYGPDCPTSLLAYFRGIDEAIAGVRAERVLLVGHSLGCVVAAGYAVYGRSRARVAALVLLSPLIVRQVESIAHPARAGLRHPLAFLQAAYFIAMAGIPWPAAVRHRVASSALLRSLAFWPIDRVPARVTADFARELFLVAEHATTQSQVVNSSDYAAERWILNPVLPTLYVEGDRDRLGSMMDRVRVMGVARSRLEIVADAGHWVQIERPEEVWLRIERFGAEL
jgi:pimeloyl-ACP methyl ester carboxylesterase